MNVPNRADLQAQLFGTIQQSEGISDGRIEEVRAMQANVGARAVYFWGQEMELARHAVAAGRALDEAGIRATAAEWGLPLIGPGLPGYNDKLSAAVRQWMFGRWLPGSAAPS